MPVENLESITASKLSIVKSNLFRCNQREKIYYEIAQQMQTTTFLSNTPLTPVIVQLWHEIIQNWPKDLFAAKMLQGISFNCGNTKQILEVAEKVFYYNQHNHFAYGMYAWGLVENYNLTKAETIANLGFKMSPSSVDPWCDHALAHIIYEKGHYEDGIYFYWHLFLPMKN